MQKTNSQSQQSGFTLMEIVVATAIFAVVVVGILALFDNVLRINRRVQAIRQVAEASRNFTEVLSREIRNGRIDYQVNDQQCDSKTYSKITNQSLAIITYSGDRLCFYYDEDTQGLILRRQTTTSTIEEAITPPQLTINPKTFRFLVRPSNDPFDKNDGIQPMVTIVAEFQINQGARDQVIIPYQSTISTDVYDLPNITNK